MRDGKNGYAPSAGIPEALEAIRGEAARKGITTVRDVFVTSGVSETVDLCISALVNPGEDILTPSPDYPLYSAVLCKLGIGLNAYDLNEDDAWQPELADIERKLTARTRAIVLINPNNPTGRCARGKSSRTSQRLPGGIILSFSGMRFTTNSFWMSILKKKRYATHCFCCGCAGCPLYNVRRDVEKLSGAGMAHWVGHRLRG